MFSNSNMPQSPSRGSTPSIICADVMITGSLHGEGDIQIDGSVEGNIRAVSLMIGESSQSTPKPTSVTLPRRAGKRAPVRVEPSERSDLLKRFVSFMAITWAGRIRQGASSPAVRQPCPAGGMT